MTTQNTQVPSAEVEVTTTPVTQDNAGKVTETVTPPAPQQDAETLAQLQAKLAAYERDVRNLKSQADKRVNEVNAQWKQTEAELRRQVEELKVASMDEESRVKYMKELDRRKQDELLTRATQADKVKEEYDASLSAIQHFTSLGVPLSELVLGQGYDTLFQSGYKYITDNYKKAASQPPLPPTAPSVATTNSSTPNLNPTMEDLIKKYGNAETVFRLVETGRLDPSIIPIE